MSNENDLGPRKGETAEQFKERILETQREMAQANASSPAPDAPSTPAPVTTAQVPAPAPNGNNPAPASTQKPEFEEWWNKKGFKSTEDLAQSYRELEREMHRRAQEAKNKEVPPAPVPTPVPQAPYNPYQPPYGHQAPPPYMPPPQYVPQPVNVEELAKRYGFVPEDFEKVAAVANDLAQSTIRQELNRVLPPLMNQVAGVNKEVARQKELVDLMGDPTFKNPQVQFEMHRVLEESPAIFEKQPQPYRYAFNEALMRVARANLGGSTLPHTTPGATGATIPSSTPPTTAGGNGGGGGGAPQNLPPEQVNPQIFAAMTLAQKQEHLRAIGAFGR